MTDRELFQKMYNLLNNEPRALVACDQLEAMLSDRLAQYDEGESNSNAALPVAWGYEGPSGQIIDIITPEEHAWNEGEYNVPLYTKPIRRPWKSLSNEEHEQIAIDCGCMSADWVFFGALVERKVKEKNT